MRSFIRGFIGIVLLVVAVFFIFYWELYGRAAILYDEIIVLNQDVKKNTVITKDMLDIQRRDNASINKNAIVDESLIIGKAANCYIFKNVQLFNDYFENQEMVLDEDEYVFKIPQEWIYSFPDSLRRGDKIYFYDILENEIETRDEKLNIKQKINEKSNEKEAILTAVVLYAKDIANREVINTSDNDRTNASSNISEIEIITTIDGVNVLKQKVKENKQFILLYK